MSIHENLVPKNPWPVVCCVLSLLGSACGGGAPPKSPAPSGDEPAALPAEPSKAPAAAEPKPGMAAPAPATEPSALPPPSTGAGPAALLAYDEADPLGDLEGADAITGPAPESALQPGGPCRELGPPQRITASDVVASVVAVGDGFVVAAYEKKGKAEQVMLRAVPAAGNGLPKPLQTLKLLDPHPTARKAAPGMHAADDHHVSVAVTDGKGRLLLADVQVARGSAGGLREIATGVDTRFAPAVAHVDKGTLVAWTVGSTPMGTHFALVPADAKPPQIADITPPRQGAAAATFVDGASPPVLLAIDARNGMSPLIRIAFDNDGIPSAPTPQGPVGMVSSAPQLAAARTSLGTRALYTGLGSASTSAVGMLAIGEEGASAEALVKGTAYGRLHVAAAAAGPYLLLAADAPLSPGKEPAHEIQISRLSADGSRETSRLRGPGKDSSQVSIARNESGVVAVTYRSGGGLYLSRLRCQ